jgi:hypothetical protein
MRSPVNQKHKWYPPTPAQEWRKIQADFELQVLKDYAKGGDPAAVAELKRRKDEQSKSE